MLYILFLLFYGDFCKEFLNYVLLKDKVFNSVGYIIDK